MSDNIFQTKTKRIRSCTDTIILFLWIIELIFLISGIVWGFSSLVLCLVWVCTLALSIIIMQLRNIAIKKVVEKSAEINTKEYYTNKVLSGEISLEDYEEKKAELDNK